MPLACEVRRPQVQPPRRGILDTSIVFNTQLWHPDLSINPFTTKPPNPQSCTVIGAAWSRLGRIFGGVADVIQTAAGIGITGNADRTVLMWTKVNTIKVETILSWGRAPACGGGANNSYDISIVGGNWYLSGNGGGNDWDTGVAADTNWNLHAIILAAGVSYWYLNNVSLGVPFVHNFNTLNSILLIGLAGCAGLYYDGIIGEIVICNRALSIPEMLNYDLATKWRYQ